MIFSSFRFQVVARTMIIVALSLGLAYTLNNTQWFFTPLVIGILLLAVTISLIRYVDKTNKDLTTFLLSIKQGGFTSFLQPGGRGKSFEGLSKIYNDILLEFQKINIEKESHYQYLKTVNENIGVALISFREDGSIEMINPVAKKLLKKPYLNHIDDIKRIDARLYEVIDNLDSEENDLVKLVIDGELLHYSVQAKTFVLQDQRFKLILLQNINSELEAKEVEAWQKLISVLTHEIMNSVTPIISLITAVNQILTDENALRKNLSKLSSEEIEDVYASLTTIENRSKALLSFVNAYKDFSKTPELKRSEFDLVDLLDQVHTLQKSDLQKYRIKFTLELSHQSVMIKGDRELLEQVIINLVKNAIEALAQQEGGIILIKVEKIKNKTRIIISDNGPGIAPEILEKIFVPFYTTKKKGTGIGLSLSRQILKMHRGSISAKSKVGKGTSFYLEI